MCRTVVWRFVAEWIRCGLQLSFRNNMQPYFSTSTGRHTNSKHFLSCLLLARRQTQPRFLSLRSYKHSSCKSDSSSSTANHRNHWSAHCLSSTPHYWLYWNAHETHGRIVLSVTIKCFPGKPELSPTSIVPWIWTLFLNSERFVIRRKTHGFCSLECFMWWTLWSCSIPAFMWCLLRARMSLYLTFQLMTAQHEQRAYTQTGASTLPTYLFGDLTAMQSQGLKYYAKTNWCLFFSSNKWPIVEVRHYSPEGSVIQERGTDGQKIPRCHDRFMMPTQICPPSWRAETQAQLCVCVYGCEFEVPLCLRWK